MQDKRLRSVKWLGLLLAVVLAVTIGGVLGKTADRIGNAQKRRSFAVARYDPPKITDPAERALRELRDKHSARFTFGLPSLDQIGGGGTTDCYAPGVRERLAIEKDTVLIGGILDAQAYLNPTKQHVYTEYRVRVEQVLKHDGDMEPSSGNEIVTERWGGGIRFPSGEIREYWVRKLGMPEVGQRYLFFLEGHKQEQDFYIWTAFKLGVDRITPLDDLDSKLLPLAAYKGSNEIEFVSEVKKFITSSNEIAKPKEN